MFHYHRLLHQELEIVYDSAGLLIFDKSISANNTVFLESIIERQHAVHGRKPGHTKGTVHTWSSQQGELVNLVLN